ncbi:MAG: HAD-IC family P-type ATPase [Chloroflexota bacterium]
MQTVQEIETTIHPSERGLTSAEVAERIKRGESNQFKARVGRTYWEIVRDNVLNLFNIVLGLLLAVVIVMGDISTALFAGFSLVTNSILGMYQEIAAKRKLDQLAALAAKDIAVYRDGELTHVPIQQLVKDDVIPIEPGDRLVVDGMILHSDSLEIDESQLTGESDAILKEVGNPASSGSFCIAGTGVMVATQVGKNSTINKLSTVAKAYKNIKTPTQQRIQAMVELTVIVMIIAGPMLFLASYMHGASLLEVVRNLVVFVSSVVPQGLVLVAVLSLTLGAISISRHQTLIQRVNAVESLANVQVLCFDKTGTLTRNQLSVTNIQPIGNHDPAEIQAKLQAYIGSLSHQNSTASAMASYLKGLVPSLNGSSVPKLREIPFNSARKWGAIVFDGETLVLGAPERVLIHAPTPVESVAQHAQDMAAQGLRVLAFARSTNVPLEGQLDNTFEPLALIILSDQIRPDIRETLQAFRDQNVALKVISGDNIDTVKSIAEAAGMIINKAYTGDQLEAMQEHEFAGAALEGDLFARIEPDTKRRIIAALKNQGKYVAMVGDGVNDVPALKEAHLAIVMNDGAQISKDVGDIVLLNNAMSTLPLAFAEGKEITQTIYATAKLFLVKNFYNIVLIFFVGFMSLPFPTSPIQISWITFGTVNIPATLIAFKIIRPKFMAKFRHDVIDYVIIAGTVGAVTLALLYVVAYFASDQNMHEARSAVTIFIALYGTLIFWHVQDMDIMRPRSLLKRWRITLLGVVLTVLTMIVPYMMPKLFVFVPPEPLIWVAIVSIFLLTSALVTMLMRNRYLINQLWKLFEP